MRCTVAGAAPWAVVIHRQGGAPVAMWSGLGQQPARTRSAFQAGRSLRSMPGASATSCSGDATMTSLRHDPRRRPQATPAAARPSAAVGQPPASTGRQTVPIVRRRRGGMHITTQHNGPVTTVRVGGGLTEIGTRHLAALLDAMVTTDCEHAIVHLADVNLVDSGLLRVLRAARTRLQGRLTVTAESDGGALPAGPGRARRGCLASPS